MMSIALACVPEQVNIPIKICQERGIFRKYGIDVIIHSVPEGTGRMLDMIEQGLVDIAITVADATIAGCAKGRPIQLCGSWVNSPLVWAIAGPSEQRKENVEPACEIDDINKLNQYKARRGLPLKFGISRFGSGSQTMAQYCCMVNRFDSDMLQFETANDFKGLRAGVASGAFDAFMWEVFTTKPWFDRQELAYLGEVATPWPAFVFTTSSGIADGGRLSNGMATVIRDKLFAALHEGVRLFIQEAQLIDDKVPQSIKRIMEEYNHTEEDARLWMSRCKYASDPTMRVNLKQIQESVGILKDVGIVPREYEDTRLWSTVDGEINSIISLS